MSDIELNLDGLMRQAVMTADDYLARAYEILKRDYDDWSVGDAIELAKVIAQDFHTSVMGLKMQEIRDSLGAIKTEIIEK